MSDAESMADRLRTIRRLHDLTQGELALLAGVSVSLISKVESGAKPGTWDLAMAVGRAVRVDPMALMGRSAVGETDDSRAAACLPALRQAIASYDDPGPAPVDPRPLAAVAADVERMNRLRLAANYAHLGEQLVPLLEELRPLAHHSSGRDRLRAFWLLAAAYRCGDALAFKLGHLDLSATIIDRIRWAAELSDDPLMVATGAYVRGQTFLVTQAWDAGLRALTAAGTPLERQSVGDPRTAAVYGALHMRASVVAARGGRPDAAWSHMRIATAMADVVSRDVEYYYTSFGPSNVKIHELAVAVELGDADEALRRAAGWDPPVSIPAERASHYLIDLARAQVWAGDMRGATGSLMSARRRAPQHTKTNPLVKQSVVAMLRHNGSRSADLTGLAMWLGVNKDRSLR